MSFFQQKNRGFTFVELLVVIAIIGFLSTIVLIGVDYVRTKARDARRGANVSELQKALALYLNVKGTYPVGSTCLTGDDTVSKELVSATVAAQVPKDPTKPSTPPPAAPAVPTNDHCYWYVSDNGSTYTLSYFLELDSQVGTKGPHSVAP